MQNLQSFELFQYKNDLTNVYHCPLCKPAIVIPKISTFMHHLLQIHGIHVRTDANGLHCPVCVVNFQSSDDHKLHLWVQHRISCQASSTQSEAVANLEVLRKETENNIAKQDEQNISFQYANELKNLDSLQLYKYKNNLTGLFHCPMCSPTVMMSKIPAFMHHLIQIHGIHILANTNEFLCPVCVMQFQCSVDQELHLWVQHRIRCQTSLIHDAAKKAIKKNVTIRNKLSSPMHMVPVAKRDAAQKTETFITKGDKKTFHTNVYNSPFEVKAIENVTAQQKFLLAKGRNPESLAKGRNPGSLAKDIVSEIVFVDDMRELFAITNGQNELISTIQTMKLKEGESCIFTVEKVLLLPVTK